MTLANKPQGAPGSGSSSFESTLQQTAASVSDEELREFARQQVKTHFGGPLRQGYIRYATSLVGHNDAEDIVNTVLVEQLVFIQGDDIDALRKRYSTPIGPLYRTSVWSRSLDLLRKRKGKPTDLRNEFSESEQDALSSSLRSGNTALSRDPADVAVEHHSQPLIELVSCLSRRSEQSSRTHLSAKDREIAVRAYVLNQNQTEVARDLNINKSTVSRSIRRTKATIQLAIYLVGVLGQEGAMPRSPNDHGRCNAHLDAFDQLEDGEHQDRLQAAAPAVQTRPEVGTRVVPEILLANLPQEERDSARDSLHRSESIYAVAVGNPHPRCVLICGTHNPTQIDRPLEFLS